MTVDALAPLYAWIKALHVLAVLAWMAGLFYLPRLFVYHVQVPLDGEQDRLFQVMERRLLRGIMNPAMIAVWTFGTMLVLTPGVVDWTSGWWHLKLLSVIGMTVFHHHLSVSRKAMARGERTRSERYWRAVNEVPTLLAVVIVVMVIVKPF